MNEQNLLDNIKSKPGSRLAKLSDEKLELLLKTTIQVVDSVLTEEDMLEIDGFGTFSRRGKDSASVSFFRPSDRLNDLISKK